MSDIENRSDIEVFISKKVIPAEVPVEIVAKQKEATVGLLRMLWARLKGNSIEDVLRMKEAAIRSYESDSFIKLHEAKRKEAEATKEYYEAELLKRQIALKDLELEEKLSRIIISQMQQKTECVERILEAIERLKQKGGNVVFDLAQIEKLLK